ncbi:hypothetical protein TSUD_268200 [Trifolium subterraneum]|uniref:Uncharacterized protein n=1 Tax=Trifolium subterraneum TaxID=3900 RepID=A0A2Z6NMQ6_TRISU|nr:hypothetical protein TSUD_268200 [Trifolium subterraneum]
MASSLSSSSSSSSLKLNQLKKTVCYFLNQSRCYAKLKHAAAASSEDFDQVADDVPTSGICRPLSEILKELNKKVPDSLIKTRIEKDGFPIRYIPWHIVNQWSGEVRNITYSADAKSVSVVYRVTLYGTDAEVQSSNLDASALYRNIEL